MESKRHVVRCLCILGGFAICLITLMARAQPLDVTLTSKAYSPTVIPVGGKFPPGGTSILTFQITNATAAQINNVTVTDNLPAGLSALTFLESSGCADLSAFGSTPTTVSATVGIPGGGVCTFSYVVRGDVAGTYANTGANITDWNGNALAFTPAVLIVESPSVGNPIPTLSRFALVLFVPALAVLAYCLRSRS